MIYIITSIKIHQQQNMINNLHKFYTQQELCYILIWNDLKYYIPSIVILSCSNSIIINIMSYINIFRLKDNIIKKLREKYTSNTLIILSQYYYHDLFNQTKTNKYLILNINITLINCTIVVLLFNETSNKITVVYNPNKQTIQLILIRRNIPNKKYFNIRNNT